MSRVCPVAFCRYCTLSVVIVCWSWLSSALAAEPAPAIAPDASAPPSPSAAVLIVELPAPLPGERAPADADAALRRRVNTHVATLRAGVHVNRAISNAGSDIRKTKWFTSSDDPRERIQWLREKTRVRAIPDTSLIEVSLDAVQDPAERVTILQELINVYLENHRQARTSALLERTQMLNTQRIKMDARLRDLEQEMQEWQLRLNADGGRVDGGGIKEIELTEMQRSLIPKLLESYRLRERLEREHSEAQKGQAADTPEMLAVLREHPRLRRLRERLDDAEVRRAVVAAQKVEKDKEKEKEAALAPLDAEIRALRDKLNSATQEARAEFRAAHLADLRARAEAAQGEAEVSTKRIENVKSDLGELHNAVAQYAKKRDEQRALRERAKEVRESIEQVMAVQGSPAAQEIRWHTMPER